MQDWISPFAINQNSWADTLRFLYMDHSCFADWAALWQENQPVRVREIQKSVYEMERIRDNGVVEMVDWKTCSYQVKQLNWQIQEAVAHGSELIVIINPGTMTFMAGLKPFLEKYPHWQILIVAKDPLECCVLARLIPLAAWLQSRRLFFTVEEPEFLRKSITQFGFGNRNAITVLSGIPQEEPDKKMPVQSFLQSDADRQSQLAEQVLRRYHEKPPSECRTVLCVDLWEGAAGGWILHDMAMAMAMRGVSVHQLLLPANAMASPSLLRKERQARVLECIDRTQPDLIMSIQNDMGDFLLPDVCADLKLPNAVYFVDFELAPAHAGRKNTLLVAASKERMAMAEPVYPLVTVMPIAASIPVAQGFSGSDLQCKLSFLGKGGSPRESRVLWESAIQNMGLMEYYQKTIQSLLHGGSLYELRRSPPLSGIPGEQARVVSFYALAEANRLRRLQFLEPLLPFGIRLFGPAWDKVSGHPMIHASARNPLPISRRFELYASSTININIHQADRHDNPCVRFFEIPAVRGFMLTDYQESYQQFLSREETVYFSTPEELVSQVDTFLTRPEARMPFCENGFQRVQRALTWDHWVEAFLENIIPVYLRILQGSKELVPSSAQYPKSRE